MNWPLYKLHAIVWQYKQITKQLNATEIKFDTGDLFTNGENNRGKISPGEFEVTIPRIYYYQSQAVTSIRNLTKPFGLSKIQTYSWTLTPIPNWTCIVTAISPFNTRIPVRDLPMMHGSQYVTNSPTLRRLLAAKFFSSSTVKIKKLLGHKTLGVNMQ